MGIEINQELGKMERQILLQQNRVDESERPLKGGRLVTANSNAYCTASRLEITPGYSFYLL